ncbi:hypothetical protein, partial [Escherichia coli]|uniref:hypothetical protein n=1 Tax=Escherichia coli TaxID=562 RepID=UPI0028DED1C2
PIRALQGLGEGAGFRDSPPPPPRQIVNPGEVSEHPFRVELRTAFEGLIGRFNASDELSSKRW